MSIKTFPFKVGAGVNFIDVGSQITGGIFYEPGHLEEGIFFGFFGYFLAGGCYGLAEGLGAGNSGLNGHPVQNIEMGLVKIYLNAGHMYTPYQMWCMLSREIGLDFGVGGEELELFGFGLGD